MSNFLKDTTLGLSPQDPFSEEMEVGSPSPTQEGEAPGSPGDQAPRDPVSIQWPQQLPEDQLLGASQLVRELSDGPASGDENDNNLTKHLPVPPIPSPPMSPD